MPVSSKLRKKKERKRKKRRVKRERGTREERREDLLDNNEKQTKNLKGRILEK